MQQRVEGALGLLCALTALAPVGVVGMTRTMPVAETSCLPDDPPNECFARCVGLTPGSSSACRVTDWYSTNILSRSAMQHEREGAYPHVDGSRILGYDRNVRTGSEPELNQLHGCNLLRAQDCITYMKNHPPAGCDMTTVVADEQPGCCSAYEPTARCIRDVGCGHHELITDLFTQCRHHGCVMGCEFSASVALRPAIAVVVLVTLLNVYIAA